MADEQQGCLVFALDFHQQIGHRRLDRYIKRRNRFIRHHNPRIARESPCNTNTLLLPARQLPRHPVGKGAGQFDQIKQLQHPFAPFCVIRTNSKDFQRPHDLSAHGHRRVERVKRVLEHHLDIGDGFRIALFDGNVADGLIVQKDLPFGRGFQSH